ncbi:MAG: excinuclease ABC subunit A, partial [Verrucomicrobiae bacterium]|nr:excinuclease ABC subunit A [Verrucomicrobiae bacterium]
MNTEVRSSAAVISVKGAREHNLKNLCVNIPRNRFVVITGVSGSGKSTLAFDILFAEGQRRFLDSMGTYARQFVDQLPRAEVDLVDGLPPTVSIEQRNSRGGGKSTVSTVTEIHHFMRLLFSKLGTIYCPRCDLPVRPVSKDEVVDRIRSRLKRCNRLRILSPLVRGRKGTYRGIAEWAWRHGYTELRVDGKFHSTNEPLHLDRFTIHNVEVVTGVLEGGRSPRSLAGSTGSVAKVVEESLRLGKGTLFTIDDNGELDVYSTERTCPKCLDSFPPPDPKQFSYNSPAGWCPNCRGFGEVFYIPSGVDRGAREEAIEESWFEWMEGQREVCPECKGARLNAFARAVRLECGEAELITGGECGKTASSTTRPTLVDIGEASVRSALAWVRKLRFTGIAARVARDILPEIRERLRFLDEVGLGYLQLGRGVPTLSGGEAQRVRLAAQLGSNLTGVLYVLDEPTIGLHPRDNERLISICKRLVAKGNSLVVVEHDEATMKAADYVVDLGPGAGVNGGQAVACGTLEELVQHQDSVTGACLRELRVYPTRGERRPVLRGNGHCGAGTSGSVSYT